MAAKKAADLILSKNKTERAARLAETDKLENAKLAAAAEATIEARNEREKEKRKAESKAVDVALKTADDEIRKKALQKKKVIRASL